MKYKDYYDVLGVSRSDSTDAIKKAYRKLARKYHPDVSKEADAADRMAQVNEAWGVLSDPEKRKVYDAVGAQAWAKGARHEDDVRPPPGWNSGFNPTGDFQGFGAAGDAGVDQSAFFEELFGRAQGRRAARGRPRGPVRGSDVHAQIQIDLVDAYVGAERSLTLRGARIDDDGHMVEDTRTLQVRIPAGVRDGQMIRLAGQGNPGADGGPAGDLLLQVQLRGDERRRAEGADVIERCMVTPWEAALGAQITVRTPGGDTLTVTVPARSNAGRRLRLKGRGLPATSAGRPAGDLYLELGIAVPGAVTDAQRDAWSALAASYPGFNPRT